MIEHRTTITLSALLIVFAGCGGRVERNRPIARWLPLGDSLTYGQKPMGEYTYRVPLIARDLADPTLPLLEPIGPAESGPMAPGLRRCYAGGGWGVDTLYTGLGNVYGPLSDNIGPGAPYHPTLISLMIGTNDAMGGQRVNTEHYRALLQQAHALEPEAVFFLSSSPPTRGHDPAREASLQAFAEELPGIWNEQRAEGLQIYSADAYSFMTAADPRDELHPSVAGHDHFAAGFWPEFSAALAVSGRWE